MQADVLIVGAGVAGLACAAELAAHGWRTLVVERREAPGRETSSRSSEVIHAGLYYPPDSLKAETCVAGRALLYERCRRRGIPHRKTGKYVVATEPAEQDQLEELCRLGREAGAGALEIIDGETLMRHEPRVRACAALWSPESGIVDAQALIASYQAELESCGGEVILHTEVVALQPLGGGRGWRVVTRSPDGERFALEVPWLVNAAGLGGDHVATLAGIDVDAAGLRQHPCKGDYFAVSPELGELVRHLIYPLPVRGGLGIHVTLDLGGRYRLGPDVEWVAEPTLVVAAEKAEAFARAAGRYLPELLAKHLTPDFAGIRPKLQAPGQGFRDFHVAEATTLGAPRLVNLLGLESPGLTAAGAIARRVRERLAAA